jgi:uncharacterized protein YraI
MDKTVSDSSSQRRDWLLGVAALLLGAAAPASLPGAGTVMTTTYLRTGPGVQYAALDEVPPQAQVAVQSCAGAWCDVRWGTVHGYIRQESLTMPDLHVKPAATPQGAACFSARLNGRPNGADGVRICEAK